MKDSTYLFFSYFIDFFRFEIYKNASNHNPNQIIDQSQKQTLPAKETSVIYPSRNVDNIEAYHNQYGLDLTDLNTGQSGTGASNFDTVILKFSANVVAISLMAFLAVGVLVASICLCAVVFNDRRVLPIEPGIFFLSTFISVRLTYVL